jgi:hypothetical protein
MICKSSRYRLAYAVDGLVLGMLAATLLDVLTTYLDSSLKLAFEMNPVLAPLIRHSLVWIPIYLLVRPLLVPLLPEIPRRAFAFYFFANGLLFGLNNLGGILFHHYFIIHTFGFWIPEGLCVFSAFGFFVYEVYRDPENRFVQIRIASGWFAIFWMIEGAFYLLGIYLKAR